MEAAIDAMRSNGIRSHEGDGVREIFTLGIVRN
jgi:hypothetical protein